MGTTTQATGTTGTTADTAASTPTGTIPAGLRPSASPIGKIIRVRLMKSVDDFVRALFQVKIMAALAGMYWGTGVGIHHIDVHWVCPAAACPGGQCSSLDVDRVRDGCWRGREFAARSSPRSMGRGLRALQAEQGVFVDFETRLTSDPQLNVAEREKVQEQAAAQLQTEARNRRQELIDIKMIPGTVTLEDPWQETGATPPPGRGAPGAAASNGAAGSTGTLSAMELTLLFTLLGLVCCFCCLALFFVAWIYRRSKKDEKKKQSQDADLEQREMQRVGSLQSVQSYPSRMRLHQVSYMSSGLNCGKSPGSMPEGNPGEPSPPGSPAALMKKRPSFPGQGYSGYSVTTVNSINTDDVEVVLPPQYGVIPPPQRGFSGALGVVQTDESGELDCGGACGTTVRTQPQT